MKFSWDPTKAMSNFRKHGVTFEEAASVFGDPLSETFEDPDHSIDEQRFVIIGRSRNGRLLFVSHTDINDELRIISAREPTGSEIREYEEGFYE
ncbi:MAG: BrnT family toxin [Acidobacteria bacterium]|nr:BrnT family toxin [Acidobacteriota bacterium]